MQQRMVGHQTVNDNNAEQTLVNETPTKETSLSVFWVIFHRACHLFEQGATSKEFVFDECVVFRDRLVKELGSVYVPDHAPEKHPSVELAMLLAYVQVRWLIETKRKRKSTNN